MKKIIFTTTHSEKEMIDLLKTNKVVSDNNFDYTGEEFDMEGRIATSSEGNAYHFSEWFESMEQLTPESRKKAYFMLSEYSPNRMLPEWYYDVAFDKTGKVEIVFKTNEIAIDVCDSGPYEYIETPELEPHLKNRIQEMFDKLNEMDMNPSFVS